MHELLHGMLLSQRRLEGWQLRLLHVEAVVEAVHPHCVGGRRAGAICSRPHAGWRLARLAHSAQLGRLEACAIPGVEELRCNKAAELVSIETELAG